MKKELLLGKWFFLCVIVVVFAMFLGGFLVAFWQVVFFECLLRGLFRMLVGLDVGRG